MKLKYTILFLTLLAFACRAQDKKIPVNLELESVSTVLVENVFGDVTVTGYDGDKIKVRGEILIEARSSSGLSKAVSEFSISYLVRNDSILIYNKAPHIKHRFMKNRNNWSIDDPGYRYMVDLEVMIPENSNIWASTINDGKVTVESVDGKVSAANINGPVALKDVDEILSAKSINGNIDIFFKKLPRSDSKFRTVNGDITLNVRSGLSTTIEFESMNGELYTDFDYSELSPEMKKIQSSKGGKTRYKIESKTRIKIGDGERFMSFNTINGNMYVKKI